MAFQLMSETSLLFADCFSSVSLVLAALTLLEAAKSLTTTVRMFDNNIDGSSGVLDQFYELKRYSETLNRFISKILFIYCIVSISYFSVNLDAVVLTQDWFGKIYVFYYIINDGSMFFISGMVCQEMNKFRDWTLRRETRKTVSLDEATVLVADLASNPVGLSGDGKFVIDNNFLGNIGITLITLFVIVLQVRHGQN